MKLKQMAQDWVDNHFAMDGECVCPDDGTCLYELLLKVFEYGYERGANDAR